MKTTEILRMVTEMSEMTTVGCLMKEFNLLRVQRDEFDSGTESDKDLSVSDDCQLRSSTHFKAVDCSYNTTCNNISAKQNFHSSIDFAQLCEKDSETDNDWELEEIFTRGCEKVRQQQEQQQQTTLRRQCASSGRWHADSVDEGFLEDCPEPVQFSSVPPEGLSHCNTLSPQAFLAYSDMDFEYCEPQQQQQQQQQQ
ncbi:hypothetical protein CAPTEDRAFT_227761 [Capitella teleta]|uniref:Uncharacterized protein n=1 Tax=Capitella teleta TaxID=283909 RepID=R7TNF0_CAPTE|nr:hypothetical protein CAPTEDRAFT_227761 [Capitella teleta]|eukprot:ELT93076.1 hypothetical protein CAPTEDRAFT_227761 [Capitella teleta]